MAEHRRSIPARSDVRKRAETLLGKGRRFRRRRFKTVVWWQFRLQRRVLPGALLAKAVCLWGSEQQCWYSLISLYFCNFYSPKNVKWSQKKDRCNMPTLLLCSHALLCLLAPFQHNAAQSPLLGRGEDGASTLCPFAVSQDRSVGA